MLNRYVVFFLAMVSLAVMVQACTTTSPQRLIDRHDHAALANYYSQEAQQFREKAKDWEFMAEFYEKHPEPDPQVSAQHAAHCRAVAQSYRKAADEAEALATEHRRQRPHGVIN